MTRQLASGASGRNESGLGGVAPRQRSFWLMADAELIVYGATDPSGSPHHRRRSVPLSTDGTFRIQVPFRDGKQPYPIAATALMANRSATSRSTSNA